MHRPSIAICAALLAASLSSSSAAAQGAPLPASSTKGVFLGFHLNGSAISGDDLTEDTETGGGLALQLGYGFTPKLALLLDVTGAALDFDGDEVGFAHVDLLLRYAFTSPTRRLVPFVEGGLTGRGLAQDDADLGTGVAGDVSLTGGGVSFGGGLQYYATPKVALGVGLKWTVGEFDRVKVDNVTVEGFDIDATSTRFNIGISWYPMTGRR